MVKARPMESPAKHSHHARTTVVRTGGSIAAQTATELGHHHDDEPVVIRRKVVPESAEAARELIDACLEPSGLALVRVPTSNLDTAGD